MQRSVLHKMLRVRRVGRAIGNGVRCVSTVASDEVLVEGSACSRKAILNSPSSLNAFTTSMVSQLHKRYQAWEDHPDIGFVMMKGAGDRAFCTGGNVVRLYQLANQGKLHECKDFFSKAYQFIYLVGTYLKPHVALLDGLTMGGGAGISIPGMFRVATDKTVFATPETQIGFHPDAGASFYLSHLPGYLGEYLGLTGERLTGAEMFIVGLATHFSVSTRISWIEERLGSLVTDDPSVIETALNEYSDVVIRDRKSVLQRMDAIDRCFSKDTVEQIICTLETEAANQNDEWYVKTIKKLKEVSPVSLKITLRSIRESRFETFHQCLTREYRITCHALSKRMSGDFYEGIRARLIEKDSSPKWDPPSLEQVSGDMVNEYFLPLTGNDLELELPVNKREAYI